MREILEKYYFQASAHRCGKIFPFTASLFAQITHTLAIQVLLKLELHTQAPILSLSSSSSYTILGSFSVWSNQPSSNTNCRSWWKHEAHTRERVDAVHWMLYFVSISIFMYFLSVASVTSSSTNLDVFNFALSSFRASFSLLFFVQSSS